jgi:hypothetical protein
MGTGTRGAGRVIYLGLPDCHECMWFKDGLCHMLIKLPDRTDASSCSGFTRQRTLAPGSPGGALDVSVGDG